MQPDASKIRNLLKKTAHFDKDERFMATNDLISELEKVDGLLDSSLQVPIRDAILKQLDDPSNDVQAIACRCLSAIVQKFNREQVEEIIDKLGSVLITCKMDVRDIYTIALKNIIGAVPDDFGTQISVKLLKRLIEGLRMTRASGETEEERQDIGRNYKNRIIACLDILKDLLVRFGVVMNDSHKDILSTVQPMLTDEKEDIRKKVAVCLGAVVGVVNDELFKGLMNNIMEQIKRISRTDKKIFTFIQTIGVFSKNGGKRVAPFLPTVVPTLIDISTDKNLKETDESAIELRENCLQAFETLVVQCPKEISDFTDELLEVGLSLMKFDPFFDYSVSETGGNEENKNDEEEEDEWGGDEEDGFGDSDGGGWDEEEDATTNQQGLNVTYEQGVMGAGNDDTSWKVRRAAIKMLAAFIQTHKEKVQEKQDVLREELLLQFREHDTSVKLEVFRTFRELLLATIVGDLSATTQTLTSLEAPTGLVRQKTELSGLIQDEKLTKIMEKIVGQMKVGNAEVKSGLLGIIRDLVIIRSAERSSRCVNLGPDGLKPFFPQLIPQIIGCINDKEIQLKTKGLHILYLILKRHSPKIGCEIVEDVKNVVIKSIGEEYSRVKAQALMTAGRIMECMRPFENNSTEYDTNFTEVAKQLYEVTFKQLSLTDVEQEVKKAALDCIAICVARFGDIVGKQCQETLNVLTKRLSNEVTRQSALKAFTTICNSPLNIDLSSVCNKCVEDMSSFLKKHSQSLKMDAAGSLKAVFGSCGAKVSMKHVEALIIQCKEFINDTDLHLCSLILELLAKLIQVQIKSAKGISQNIFPVCFKFLESPLLQGYALESLKRLFEIFQQSTNGKVVNFQTLKNELIKAAQPKLSRQSYSAISQCLSTLCLQITDKSQHNAITELVSLIKSKNDEHSQVSLLCLGEIGKRKDLSDHSDIETKIFNGFYRESESVKWAASFALGNVAVGNMEKYVPVLLKMIQEKQEKQYLLLNSLKEIISHYSANQELATNVTKYADTIVPLLLKNSSSDDEGVRAMVAECLGKFAIIDDEIFDRIENLLSSEQTTTRATMAASLKFSINKSSTLIPESTVLKFLELMQDKDLNVKRQAFLTINVMLHINSGLIKEHLQSKILPVVYAATVTNEKLIREVDLGPFKHKIDDGLPLRKAAYFCMDTLLEAVSSKLDLNDFLKHLTNGIQDESHDIQMITYQVLYRLAQFHGAAILSALDELPKPLMAGIKLKMKEAKGNKDAERAKDILRASCKALFTLRSIPSVLRAKKFVDFYSRVEKTKVLIPMLKELKQNSKR